MSEPERRINDRLRDVIDTMTESQTEVLSHLIEQWELGVARLTRRVNIALLWVATISIVGALLLAINYLDERGDRRRAIVSACGARNNLAEANLRFLGRVAPSLVDVARKDFPIEPNCEDYADRVLQR